MSSPAPSALQRVAPFGFSTVVTFFAVSGAPTPLYHIYQETYGFAASTITIIFAMYVASLLIGLLLFGGLSDFIGRRPVVFAGLLFNLAALAAFLMADGASMLIFARFLQGLGTGLAIPALGAQILDTAPKNGPVLNSAGAFVGLMTGTLLSAILVTYAPDPTHTVYLVLVVVILLEMALLLVIPETVTRKPGAIASLRPRVSIPPRAMSAVLRTAPVNIAGWALGGFYLSLMPSLVSAATGNHSPLVGGAVVSALMLTSVIVVIATGKSRPTSVLTVGSSALVAGVVVTMLGVSLHQTVLMFAGTVIAGIGFGGNFGAILRTVLPFADQDDRAALLSTFFVQSYLAFALPAIAAGMAAPVLGLVTTTYLYGTAIVILALTSLVAIRRLEPSAN
ncbi:MFS transporter [Agrobacterium sp. ES01]|uniref:MFS transporter n=1 Tax=Agrobacterium sp. ES01 TaxID=3420714 RepID=UPI003D12D39A